MHKFSTSRKCVWFFASVAQGSNGRVGEFHSVFYSLKQDEIQSFKLEARLG